jgi:hypothetical protein
MMNNAAEVSASARRKIAAAQKTRWVASEQRRRRRLSKLGSLLRNRKCKWGFGFGCEIIKKRFGWMFDGNRVRGVIDEPNAFSINGMRDSENLPRVSRRLPLLSLPYSFQCG